MVLKIQQDLSNNEELCTISEVTSKSCADRSRQNIEKIEYFHSALIQQAKRASRIKEKAIEEGKAVRYCRHHRNSNSSVRVESKH